MLKPKTAVVVAGMYGQKLSLARGVGLLRKAGVDRPQRGLALGGFGYTQRGQWQHDEQKHGTNGEHSAVIIAAPVGSCNRATPPTGCGTGKGPPLPFVFTIRRPITAQPTVSLV